MWPFNTPPFFSSLSSNPPSLQQRIRNAAFLHRELAIRIAKRAVDLDTLPFGLAQTTPIEEATRTYVGYVEKLVELPAPADADTESRFTDLLKSLVLDRLNIPQRIQMGLASLKDSRRTPLTEGLHAMETLDTALYEFFLARVGLRFLVEHHIASDPRNPEKSQGGLIRKDLDPVQECRAVADEVIGVLQSKFNTAPAIDILVAKTSLEDEDDEEDDDDRIGRKVKYFKEHPNHICYVPSHLRYMVSELLMNSAQATMRMHQAKRNELGTLSLSDQLPPIKVVVAIGKEDLCIRISDQGGGISRKRLDKIYTFAHSTLEDGEVVQEIFPTGLLEPPPADEVKQVRGFGLPLARIYARYFGGELVVKTMEGYGVDAYLHLPVLGTECEHLSDAVENSPGNMTSAEKEMDSSWEALLAKRAL